MKFSCGYLYQTAQHNIPAEERSTSWRLNSESTAPLVPMTSQFCSLTTTHEKADDAVFDEAASGECSTNTSDCTSFPRVPDRSVTAWSYAQEQRLYQKSWYPYYDGSTAPRSDNFCCVNKGPERLLDSYQSVVNISQANNHGNYRLQPSRHHFDEAQNDAVALYHNWTTPEVTLSQYGPSQTRLLDP